MALDKQKILNELGSVMSKLQSADCGCMGKLFNGYSNKDQQANQGGAPMGYSHPNCGGYNSGCCNGHGYCSQNYSQQYTGGPYSSTQPFMGRGCMGMSCNPTKLYSDTYNYLNTNLMKPVIQEVCEDLRSLNSDNTVVHNPLAEQMGLQHGGTAMQGMKHNHNPGSNMGGEHDPNMSMTQPMGQSRVGGGDMGQNIMNMMMSAKEKQANSAHFTGAMPNAVQQGQSYGGASEGHYNTKMSDLNTENQQVQSRFKQHQTYGRNGGEMGQNIMNMMMSAKEKQANPAHFTGAMPNAVQQGQSYGGASEGHYNTKMSDLNTENQQVQSRFKQDQTYGQNAMGENIPQYTMSGNHSSPATQLAKRTQPNYGIHTPGMAKFHEMFPGLGDLGYDPMSLAMQMNPRNRQITKPSATQQNPQVCSNSDEHKLNSQQSVLQQQQQVCSATGVPTMNQNQPLQLQQQHFDPNSQQQQNAYPSVQEYQQYSCYMDPNLKKMRAPNQTEIRETPTAEASQPLQDNRPEEITKDLILPVDTLNNQSLYTRHIKNDYNTLGQPVQLLPAKLYHQEPDQNPQRALYPQSTPMSNVPAYKSNSRYSVKGTVSKTSLMGRRPDGRVPSRSQLQKIYNKYKGSQSSTQQNIRSPGQGGTTFSEGRMNVNSHKPCQAMPLEKVGGDNIANNQLNTPIPVNGQHVGQSGDVPANKPEGDICPVASHTPMSKCRNGLQDLAYTPYTTAAWSFHGYKDF